MKLVLAHLRADLRELLRIPALSIPTIGFPVLFFIFFGVPNARDADTANLLMASFAAFGVLGVAVFKFGVSTALDRGSAWPAHRRTRPRIISPPSASASRPGRSIQPGRRLAPRD